jgi:isoleucyl-tRNA synthetase
VRKGLETYDVAIACNEIAAFMEILNNWYIRRTRDRFWEGDTTAFDVLYTVLVNLSKIMAPLMPFVCEHVYKNLTGEESVHLADYPDLSAIDDNENLMTEMDFLQELCSAGKFIREEKNLRNRLPLSKLTVVGRHLNDEYQEIVKDELNVKQVCFDDNLENYATKRIYLYTPLLGKALGKDMGAVMAAYKQGQWQLNADGTLNIAGKNLTSDLFEVRLEMKDGVAGQAFAENKALVMLDTNVTDELKREGMARDFIRLVQTLRKDKNFNISDRIALYWQTNDETLAMALKENEGYIAEQVLAVKTDSTCAHGTTADIEGASVCFDVEVMTSMSKGA